MADMFDKWDKEIDTEGLQKDVDEAAKNGKILTLEDHNVNTGMGSIMSVEMMKAGIFAELRSLGVTDYGPSGSADDVRKFMGLTPENVIKNVREML